MNKSDLEKMQKCQEEYEKFLEESPLHSVIDEIANDIRDRQDNIMAMEFTRTIAELLRENGIVVHCQEYQNTEDISEKSIKTEYEVIFDSVDCTEHDRKFTDRIKELEEELTKKQTEIDKLSKDNSSYRNANIYYQKNLKDYEQKNKSLWQQRDKLEKQISEIEIRLNMAETKLFSNVDRAYYESKIEELESELSVKENLLRIKNGLCEEKPVTENKVKLKWGSEEILGVKIENLQLTANQILQEVQTLVNKENMMSDKERRTPHLYANAIIEDTSDFHNFWGDDKMHESAEIRRVDFLREVAEHLLVYCNRNSEVQEC